MASELIIQLQDNSGSFSCEKFDNFPSQKSAYIAICHTNNPQSEKLANDLKASLINSLKNLERKFLTSQPPCGGHAVGFNGCQALSIPSNIKLLIVVSDGLSNSFSDISVLSWTHTILPVLQTGVSVNLPNPFNLPQVAFWNSKIDEVLPTIFSLVGISEEDQRIFISYKRADSEPLAIQLFDQLNHIGFEVFLDRFSIKPGVNFQDRLYQELSDKAMVLFLESPNYLNSEWVGYEINFAKANRLGVFAININSSPKTPLIDDEIRAFLNPPDFDSQLLLTQTAIDNLITKIRMQHSIALYRMKNYLNDNIVLALENKGAIVELDNNGFIEVTNSGRRKNYKILTTPRPPKLTDYEFSDNSNPMSEKIIFGPKFMEEKRENLNYWLSRKSDVSFYNEGEILSLSNLVYP
ncbi:MAG: toll/interleukin-1 receptor domain-containing protein [Chitinophagaceae bacterium]|nr:toll/interleukin-1 receptor domain-containing protein [Chitinophagaceae bacterium]